MTSEVSAVESPASPADTVRRRGVALMVLSAIVFSTAGLFSKGVESGSWTIIFWRGVFAILFSAAFVLYRGSARREFCEMGLSGIAVGVVGAAGTAAFIASFKFTTIANVSLIYATGPLLAATIAWIWFRESPGRVVVMASLVAFGGVSIIVSGSLGGIHLRGDLMALWMTLMLSIIMVIYRRYPDTPAIGPSVLSCLLLLPASMILDDPFAAPVEEIPIMAAFGLVFAIASVTLAEGARRLPPAEASLISALEVPLAPIWAWMIFTELPGIYTVMGGTIILSAVFGSQVWAMRHRKD